MRCHTLPADILKCANQSPNTSVVSTIMCHTMAALLMIPQNLPGRTSTISPEGVCRYATLLNSGSFATYFDIYDVTALMLSAARTSQNGGAMSRLSGLSRTSGRVPPSRQLSQYCKP